MSLYTFCIFVLLVITPISVYSKPKDEKDIAIENGKKQLSIMFSVHQCAKEKICKHDGKKVCAYEAFTRDVSVFKDRCTVHKTNCKKTSSYLIIQLEPCNAKNFQTEIVDKELMYPLDLQQSKLSSAL